MGYICFLLLIISVLAKPQLKFNATGQFKIMQLTDTHYDYFNIDIPQTLNMVTNFLTWEKPDFVAFTGDLLTGYLWNGTADWFYDRWSPHAALLTKFGIPWGYALGNHDGEADLNRRECVELDATAPLSFSKPGPAYMGNSTFYTTVYDKSGTKPMWNL